MNNLNIMEEEVILKQELKNEGEVVFIITLIKEKKGYFLHSNNFKKTFKRYVGFSIPFARKQYKNEVKSARELIKLSKLEFKF